MVELLSFQISIALISRSVSKMMYLFNYNIQWGDSGLYILGKLVFSVAMSIMRLIHHGAMNGAQDSPKLLNSGPIMLTLSSDPLFDASG